MTTLGTFLVLLGGVFLILLGGTLIGFLLLSFVFNQAFEEVTKGFFGSMMTPVTKESSLSDAILTVVWLVAIFGLIGGGTWLVL